MESYESMETQQAPRRHGADEHNTNIEMVVTKKHNKLSCRGLTSTGFVVEMKMPVSNQTSAEHGKTT